MRPMFHAIELSCRITTTPLISIICLVGLVGGCGNELAPAPRHHDGWNQSRNADHEIFDIVLSDLFNNPDFYQNKRPKIILSDTTVGMPLGGLDQCPVNDEIIPFDIIEDLCNRNTVGKPYSLINYHPLNNHILLLNYSNFMTSDGSFRDGYADVRGFVKAALPGYSRDGQAALFRFAFGPTDHYNFGYYRLDRLDGGWRIVSRFLYYGS